MRVFGLPWPNLGHLLLRCVPEAAPGLRDAATLCPFAAPKTAR